LKKKELRFHIGDQMSKDIETVRLDFKKKFGVMPSNVQIFNLLMKSYKTKKDKLYRKKKSKQFEFRI